MIGKDYVQECIKQDKLLSVENYLVYGKSKSDNLKEGKIFSKDESQKKKKAKRIFYDLNKIKVINDNLDDIFQNSSFNNDWQIAKGSLLYVSCDIFPILCLLKLPYFYFYFFRMKIVRIFAF